MKNNLPKIVIGLSLIIAIALVVIFREQIDVDIMQEWIEQLGWFGPFIFMLIYATGTILFFPGSVLTITGGAVFGPIWGTLVNLTSATIGAGISFLVARYELGEWVEKKIGGRIKLLKEGVENEGWRFVAFVRLVPLFPFNLLNYALGLTRIKFWHYFITSFICMFPGTLAYTYLGYVGREAIAGEEGLIQKGLIGLALLACVAFIPRIVKLIKNIKMAEG